MTEKNIKEMVEITTSIKDVYIRTRNILEDELGLGEDINRPEMFALNSIISEIMELYIKVEEITSNFLS